MYPFGSVSAATYCSVELGMPVVRRTTVVPTMPAMPGVQLGVRSLNVHGGAAIAAPQNRSTSPVHDTVMVSPGTNATPGSIRTERPPFVNVTCVGAGVVDR